MKNQYLFERLNKKDLPTEADKAAIFFAMLKLSSESVHVTSFENISEVENWLIKEQYYVARRVFAHKGKTVVLKGRVVLAESPNLVLFLRAAIEEKDLRPRLISPRFADEPQQVILVSEDEFHLYLAGPLEATPIFK
jgi:hypothetical protein